MDSDTNRFVLQGTRSTRLGGLTIELVTKPLRHVINEEWLAVARN